MSEAPLELVEGQAQHLHRLFRELWEKRNYAPHIYEPSQANIGQARTRPCIAHVPWSPRPGGPVTDKVCHYSREMHSDDMTGWGELSDARREEFRELARPIVTEAYAAGIHFAATGERAVESHASPA